MRHDLLGLEHGVGDVGAAKEMDLTYYEAGGTSGVLGGVRMES